MPTEKQLAASRANGQKSQGPVTEAGKANSRFNALKHGIHAESQIIANESAEELAEFTAELHAEYQPASPAERFLVDTLISTEWRLRRLRNAETALWSETFADAAPHLERLQRIVNSCERNYLRALKELRQLQAARQTQAAEAPSQDSSTPGPQPQQNNSDSDPSGSFRRFLDAYLGFAPGEVDAMEDLTVEEEYAQIMAKNAV